MDSAKWKIVKSKFSAVLDLPADDRLKFLARETDEDIRREVESLLNAHETAVDFIDEPFLVRQGFTENRFEENLVGKQLDDYIILKEIGEGGMGAVFLAEHRVEDFTQKVALKIIKRGMDTAAVLKRFFMERRILAQLEHPNIARLIDGGSTADGLPYLVMEYVQGESIKKFCDINCFDTRERLELFQKVCAAVSYAHQKLIVHRDIKPSNIIVTQTGEPKLLDFGIAKLFSADWSSSKPEATATNLHAMTPEYASPEQIRGKMTTIVTDVYSLGVVLYELLTGTRPFHFKSKNPYEISEEILTKEPLPPSRSADSKIPVSNAATSAGKNSPNDLEKTPEEETRPKPHIVNRKSLRGDLDNIILKAIRREPERRYQSVQEFSEDIRRHLNGLPVTATADSKSYRLSKFIGRHKQGVVISAVVGVGFFVLSAIAVWQGIVAVQERDKARTRFEKLRETAKSLMYETRDSLDEVPGTIKLRKSLSEKSVELLDSVYDENSKDPIFFKELADSYEKLSRTQLWEFRDFEAALKACARAVEIRRKNVELEPAQLSRKTELAVSLSTLTEILYLQKNRESLVKTQTELETILREIAAQNPSVQNLSNLGQHLLGFVGTYKEFETITGEREKLREAISIFQKIIDGGQNKNLSPAEKTDLAWTLICQGLAYRKLEDADSAALKFGQAAELGESAYRADNSLQLAFNYSNFSHRNLGEIYEKNNDYKKALEIYRHSIDWIKLRENNESQSKPNYAWRLSNSANRCALMLLRLGRKTEASELILKPWREYSVFLNTETNAASLVYAEEPLIYLAEYYAESGQTEKAAEVWREQFERLQKFLDKNPNDIGFINYQAAAQNRIGDIYGGFNEKSDSFQTSDVKRLAAAKIHYQKSAELYRKSKSLSAPTHAGQEETLNEILRKLNNLTVKTPASGSITSAGKT